MGRLMILTGPMGGHGGEESVITNFVQKMGHIYKIELVVSEVIGDSLWTKQLTSLDSLYLNEKTNKLMKMIKVFSQLIKTNANAVLCMTPRMVFFSWLIRLLFHKKFSVISWVQFSISNKFSTQTAQLLTKADAHLAISSGIKQQLIELGVPKDFIFIVYNLIEKQNKIIVPTNGSTTKFIYVARIQFAGDKNLRELFDALLLVHGDWTLEIYGNDESVDKIEFKKCQAYIKQLNIGDHIKWMGWQPDIWHSIDEADCLVLTSRAEGFGMVLCEAISFGIPVISANCPIGPKDIVNYDNGFLYPMGDIKQLASYLQGFIDQKYHFNIKRIKTSITYLYSDNYVTRFEQIFQHL